jgi:hypothetical protein
MTPTKVIFTPCEQEIDMSTKGGVRHYGKGVEQLPTKLSGKVWDSRLFIDDVTSHAAGE